MFLREVKRENRNGTQVSYLQLVHNDWDPAARTSRTKILYSFGRTDQVDTAAIERLIVSLSRLLDPAAALRATAGSDLSFICSRPLGGTDVLDGLWRRLGIDTAMSRLLATRRGGSPFERVLFGLVANRALAPSSKLAAADWITHDVHIDGLPETSDDVCYRAMDWLHDVREHVEREVFGQVANLLNLEVDLLFFDTTSTYFEREDPDEPVARDEHGHPLPTHRAGNAAEGEQDGEGAEDEANKVGFRTYGKSKDSRDDLPQIVIGMAVTRDGIPVRVWCWPGNTADSALIRQVKDDMRDWTLSKIVWVADRGFSSERNRRYLRQGDHAYIIGEKLRSDSPEIKAALSRQGRYTDIGENMRVKEVKISDTERFVICHNPDAATRDAHIREQLVAQLEELIAGSDSLPVLKRGELRGKISTKPGLNRYLRITPGGLLRIDKARMQGRGQPRREVPAALLGPAPAGRRHRAGLQAAPRGRTRLAGHEADPRPAPGLSPPRTTHPRPRRAVLARAAAHPHHRDHHRPDLAPRAPRPRPAPRRHLHRPHRDLPPAHRPHQAADRPLRPARPPPPQEDHRDHPRRALTRHDAAA